MSKVDKSEDTLTKEYFVTCWCSTGLPPDDPYLRRLVGYLPESSPVSEELRTVAVAERMWQVRNDKIRLVEILRRPKKIAECLEEFNKWRRSEGVYSEPGCCSPFSAYMLGKVIDGAVACLRASNSEVVL